jgi:hypothetical protein
MSAPSLPIARLAFGAAVVLHASSSAAATCSTDGLSTVDPSGTVTPCAPYRCNPIGATAGTCFDACGSTAVDCAPTYACDTIVDACVTACIADADCPTRDFCTDDKVCRSRQSWSGCAVTDRRADGDATPIGGLALAIGALACVGLGRRR